MNQQVAQIFSRVILSGETIHIKLLGDSITHGVMGQNFEQDGPVIVPGWNRNLSGHCWANKFKTHMESQYNCTVTNNGCTGTEIQFILDHFDELVDEQDHIVLCTIGTNNRHQYFKNGPKHTRQEHMQEFYQKILALQKRFKESGKDYIFMANIPASAENEKDGEDYWRHFHMNDIQDMYRKASVVCGFPLISMYTRFLNYCKQNQISVDSLLADGLHPNDQGYDVIYQLFMEEIGLAEAVSDFSLSQK